MIKIFVFFITFNFLLGCAATPNERTQYPAPHNDYSGRLVLKHFSDENQDEFMIRTCKYYGGVNQDTKTIIGEDFFLQEVIEFKCNYHGKLQYRIYWIFEWERERDFLYTIS